MAGTPSIGNYTPAGENPNASQAGVTPAGTLSPTTPAPTQSTPPAAGPNTGPYGQALSPPNTPAAGPQPTTLSPDISGQILPGGNENPATPGQPAKPAKKLDEGQLVQEIANELKVKKPANGTLEQKVIDTLAQKYGVRIQTSRPAQGGVGGLRHDIAGWFDDATHIVNSVGNVVGEALIPGEADKAIARSQEESTQQVDEALKIKAPGLREAALAHLNGNGPLAQARTRVKGNKDQLGQNTVPDQSKAALSQMLGNVAEKMGINASVEGQTGLSQVAERMDLPTSTQATVALPGTSGTPQTAGEAYVNFLKQAFVGGQIGGNLTADGKTWATDLQNAGYLDKNFGNDVTTSTGGIGAAPVNGQQLAGAFQQVLTAAVTQKQSVNAVLAAGPSTVGTAPASAGSEMEAYVNGVATEFGVGLSQQQIAIIANQYGASASTAADPTSVEDQIKDAVVALYDPNNPNNPAGVANTMFTDIQQQALAYQIPISKQAIADMVKTDLQGATVESMYVAADAAESKATEQFQQMAQGLYPTLSAQIGAGQTVQNLVQPYFQVAQEYTGVPASTMMADQQKGGVSKWASFLQGGTDPKAGTPTLQTLDQWKKTLMQNPIYGFDKTQGARDMAEQLSSAILNEFGKVNTGGPEQALNSYSPNQALEANTT